MTRINAIVCRYAVIWFQRYSLTDQVTIDDRVAANTTAPPMPMAVDVLDTQK